MSCGLLMIKIFCYGIIKTSFINDVEREQCESGAKPGQTRRSGIFSLPSRGVNMKRSALIISIK